MTISSKKTTTTQRTHRTDHEASRVPYLREEMLTIFFTRSASATPPIDEAAKSSMKTAAKKATLGPPSIHDASTTPTPREPNGIPNCNTTTV